MRDMSPDNRSDERRDAAAFAELYDRHAHDLLRWLIRQTTSTHNPFGAAGSGPVLMRHHPEALARENRASEAELAAHGVTARCGTDPGHPLACFLPSGAPVAAEDLGPVLERAASAGDYDLRALTPAAAHAWLCAHPSQRPGADGGERPAPTAGYEDC
jgi:hypothetical protein